MRYLVILGIVLLGIATTAHLDAQQPTTSSPAQPAEPGGASGGTMPMEMCRQMMAGGVSPCCGSQMKDMMSQCIAQFQAKEGK